MLGNRVKKALKDAGIPFARAAAEMGISEGSLYNIFKKESFEVSYLLKAAEMLGVPPSFFLDDSEKSTPLTQTGIANQSGGSNNAQKIRVSGGGTDDWQAKYQSCIGERDSLKQQLSLAAALVASKDETITLLRASYNRPN